MAHYLDMKNSPMSYYQNISKGMNVMELTWFPLLQGFHNPSYHRYWEINCDIIFIIMWAVTCDFQRCGILTCVKSDEPVQPPFKLINSIWCSICSLRVIEYSKDSQRLWSDCAYAQADLSLCWSHRPHCWKSHVTTHMYVCNLCSSVFWELRGPSLWDGSLQLPQAKFYLAIPSSNLELYSRFKWHPHTFSLLGSTLLRLKDLDQKYNILVKNYGLAFLEVCGGIPKLNCIKSGGEVH